MSEEGYKPTEEEIQKAEDAMTDEQKLQSDAREEGYNLAKSESMETSDFEVKRTDFKYTYGTMLNIQQKERYSGDGDKKWRLPTTEELQDILRANGSELYNVGPYWTSDYESDDNFGIRNVKVVSVENGKITIESVPVKETFHEGVLIKEK